MKIPVGLIPEKITYVEEILKTEGIPFNKTNADKARNYNIIIAKEPDRLERFVFNGGTLILIKPSNAFSLKKTDEDVDNGFIEIKGEHRYYNCRVFGKSIKYKNGNEILKLLRKNKKYAFPAILEKKYGKGKIIIIAFDIITTILSYQQHPPNKDKNRNKRYDSDDASVVPHGIWRMFIQKGINKVFGKIRKIYIPRVPKEVLLPQADIIIKAFAQLIENNSNIPLPRLWYFPNGSLSLFSLACDSDVAEESEIRNVFKLAKNYGVDITHFIDITAMKNKKWLKKTRTDIQLHPVLNKVSENEIKEQIRNIRKFVNVKGARIHNLIWSEKIPQWLENSEIEFDSSLGFLYAYGYAFSGKPYFFRKNKKRINVLEIPPILLDYPILCNDELGISTKKAIKITKEFMDYSEKYNTIITINSHHIYLNENNTKAAKEIQVQEWFKSVIEYAKSKEIPIMPMKAINDFWRRRDKVRINDIEYDKNCISFRVSGNIKNIAITIPETRGKRISSISVNGRKNKFYVKRISGKDYAFIITDIKGEKKISANLISE